MQSPTCVLVCAEIPFVSLETMTPNWPQRTGCRVSLLRFSCSQLGCVSVNLLVSFASYATYGSSSSFWDVRGNTFVGNRAALLAEVKRRCLPVGAL